MIRRNDALEYHRAGRPGKIEVVPTKPLVTQRDLSLAYSPGVAEPCLEIAASPELAWDYTARGNLVAVVTNGTAVLGLGNIGPLAGKPVMEGKACLFKKFADIDVYDLEVDAREPQLFIDSSMSLARTSSAPRKMYGNPSTLLTWLGKSLRPVATIASGRAALASG